MYVKWCLKNYENMLLPNMLVKNEIKRMKNFITAALTETFRRIDQTSKVNCHTEFTSVLAQIT
jgi:hypothetical protein